MNKNLMSRNRYYFEKKTRRKTDEKVKNKKKAERNGFYLPLPLEKY